MKTVKELKIEIEKLEKGLKSPALPANVKPTMEKALAKAKEALSEAEKPAEKEVKAEKKEKKGKGKKKAPKFKKGDVVETYLDNVGDPLAYSNDTHKERHAGAITKIKWNDEFKRYEYTFGSKGNVNVFLDGDISLVKSTPKKSSKRFPERNRYHVNPDAETTKIGHFHEIKKVNGDTYLFTNVKEDVPKVEFEIMRKADKKWHISCRTGRKTFNSFQGSVNYVARSLYQQDILPIIKEKEKKIKADADRRKERAEKGLPPVKTPAESAKSAKTAVVKKIKDKKDDDEKVSKDINAILRADIEKYNDLIKIKDNDDKVDRTLCRKLTTVIKRLK